MMYHMSGAIGVAVLVPEYDGNIMGNRRICTFILCVALSMALFCGGVFEAFGAEAGAARGDGSDPGRGVFETLGAETGAAHDDGLNPDVAAIEAVTSEPEDGAEYDGYIVKLDEGAAARDVDEKAMEKSVDEIVTDDIVVVGDPADVLAFAEPEAVEYIEPNYKLDSFAFPDDDPRDWMYTHPLNYQWGIKYAGAKSAWLSGYDGTGVNIAILDSGVVYGHEDLNQSKVLDSFNFTSDDADKGNAADGFKHGSMVTGIIAAETDNINPHSGLGVGMAGLTDKAGLLIYKVIDDTGDGSSADVIKAYERILNSPIRVDVINMSIGHTGYSQAENNKVRQLNDKGVIIVAAAGNNGNAEDGARDEVYYPAGYNGVIGVGSVGGGGMVSAFSTKNASVDVSAPGESIIGFSHVHKSGTYAYLPGSGTSFATPIVAAAAAMFKQHDKSLDAKSFLSAIKSTATDAGAKGYDTSYGYGILSLPALIAHMDKTTQLGNQQIDDPPGDTPDSTPDDGQVSDQTPGETPPGDTVVENKAGPAEKKAVNKKAVKRCKVSFAVNGGKRLAKSKRSKTVTIGKKYGKLPTPKRGGHKFKGWYTKRKGGTRVTRSTVMKSSKGTLTLYAHWKKK
ncbi:MAG: S8 family serine peptidase [Clostridiales Family XIII bacterium]|jgi:uncharacterized repeat protein (TIGR02543 family)|nr:S8 family serine peptidase [Clostridiales Family XIII bacterium]